MLICNVQCTTEFCLFGKNMAAILKMTAKMASKIFETRTNGFCGLEILYFDILHGNIILEMNSEEFAFNFGRHFENDE